MHKRNSATCPRFLVMVHNAPGLCFNQTDTTLASFSYYEQVKPDIMYEPSALSNWDLSMHARHFCYLFCWNVTIHCCAVQCNTVSLTWYEFGCVPTCLLHIYASMCKLDAVQYHGYQQLLWRMLSCEFNGVMEHMSYANMETVISIHFDCWR